MAAVERLQHVSVPMPTGGEAEARRFYGQLLGLDEVPPPADLRHLSLVWFQTRDGGQEVHCFAEDRLGPNSAAQHLCLQVDDLAAFRARLGEHDVTVEETTAIRNRPRFFVRDPFGNLIELTQILGDYEVKGRRLED